MAAKRGGRGAGKAARPVRNQPKEPFSWEGGAPGYQPIDPAAQLPHAPMPGAPPYPAGQALPPAGISAPVPYTRALAGAAVWGAVAFLLTSFFGNQASAIGWTIQIMWIVICVAGASWPTFVVAKKRGWSELWKLALVALPAFWFLRAITSILHALLLA